MVTGFTLAFARALGEYGSIVFISGNIPLKTEITTLLIVGRLENYDYAGAPPLPSACLCCHCPAVPDQLSTISRAKTGRSLTWNDLEEATMSEPRIVRWILIAVASFFLGFFLSFPLRPFLWRRSEKDLLFIARPLRSRTP